MDKKIAEYTNKNVDVLDEDRFVTIWTTSFGEQSSTYDYW